MSQSNLISVSQTEALAEVMQLHAEIIGAAKTTLDKGIRVGELLTNIRSTLKHGEWLRWCEANLPFDSRTARNYTRVFNARGILKLENVSNLSEAYSFLAEDRFDSSKPITQQEAEDIEDRIVEGINGMLNEVASVVEFGQQGKFRPEFETFDQYLDEHFYSATEFWQLARWAADLDDALRGNGKFSDVIKRLMDGELCFLSKWRFASMRVYARPSASEIQQRNQVPEAQAQASTQTESDS
jgi:hypothetical protein